MLLAVTVVFGAALCFFAPSIKTLNNTSYFTVDEDPDVRYQEDVVEKVFETGDFFVVAFREPDIFTFESLSLLKKLTEEIESLEEVQDATSLANVNDMVGGEDYFSVEKFLEEVPRDPEGLRRLKERALGNPLYLKNLISADGRTAAIVVFTYDRPEDPDYQKRLVDKVRAIVAPNGGAERFHLAGWPVTDTSLSQYMYRDLSKFVPLTFLFVVLTVV
ncbi:MAG: MMPL family transporter, partial [Vicinamibacteria bacterium]